MKQFLRKFLRDCKAESRYSIFIGLALTIVIAYSLVPTIYTTISGTNTTGWSTLTGGSGALAIFQLGLLIFCSAIVIFVIKEALGD